MELRQALFGRLIDDAGQFPPARLPVDVAADNHRVARQGPYEWLLGRFLCPASRLGELNADPDWTIGVISDGHWRDDLDAALAAGADCLELRDPGEEAYEVLAQAPVTVFVEDPESFEALADHGLGAKLRCGGTSVEAFPSDEEVAGFIAACRERDLPFKATAGLHHPFRTSHPDLEVLQHGFVNLLAATILDIEHAEAIIAEHDPTAFVIDGHRLRWRGYETGEGWVRLGRSRFNAFGSCSFAEPVEDLIAHGILEPVRA